MNSRLLSAVCVFSFAISPNAVLAGATFTPLGDLDGGDFYSSPQRISADGSVVVGVSVGYGTTGAGREAIRWTSAGGIESLGTPLDENSIGRDTSDDGSIVVGKTEDTAFYWTSASGMVIINDVAGGTFNHRDAWGVSSDGLVIVGEGISMLGNSEAFLWTSAGGTLGLGYLPTIPSGYRPSSFATSISGDSSVVVGFALSTDAGEEAFRWTNVAGMVGLGDFPGGDFRSRAYNVSDDGSVIVGVGEVGDTSDPDPYSRSWRSAFRWTSEGGMVKLQDHPDPIFESEAFGVSGDGSVIVGFFFPPPPSGVTTGQAFRWTSASGMVSVASMLIAGGIDLTGWNLNSAHHASTVGNKIIGQGVNPSGVLEGWIADLGTNPIADAGDDQPLEMPGLVGLDGSLSIDPDGDSITHFWTLSTPPGSSAVLDDPTLIAPSFTVDLYGDYVATLVVTDIVGLVSDPDSVTVGFANLAPMADAGSNQAVVVGDTVFLDGIGSTDANMDMLSYLWNFVSTPAGSSSMLIAPMTISPSFVPDRAGDYSVQLIVNDGLLPSPPDTVLITAIDMADAAAQGALDLIAAINSLSPDDFVNRNMQRALTNKVLAVLRMIERGDYTEALNKLTNDVLPKTDGCEISGYPDSNDWIISCAAQSLIYPLVLEEIEFVRRLI